MKQNSPFKYKLVIFDFDGTLCATHDAIVYCIRKTFAHLRGEGPEEKQITDTVSAGIGLEETFRTLGLKENEEIELWVSTYRKFYANHGLEKMHLFNGVKKLFSLLVQSKISIAVVSNKGIAAVETALKHFGLVDYVSLTVGDTEGFEKKPSPLVFTKFIQPKFSFFSLQSILIVGDTHADIMFAKNIGIDSCWASYGYGNREKCLALKPTLTISTLIDGEHKIPGGRTS